MKGIPITECRTCPHKDETDYWSSDGWDRMCTWVCKLANRRKIKGAVEWHDENKIGQPDWCPLPDIPDLKRECSDIPPLLDQEGNKIFDRHEMGS